MAIKQLLSLYLFALALLACTHSISDNDKNVLYTEYKAFSALLNAEAEYNASTLNEIFSSLTHRKQAHLLNANRQSEDLLSTLVNEYLTFPFWISREYNHYESKTGAKGCLLLNGYNEALEPITITVSYHNNEKWLIDDLYVEHLAPPNKFLSRAICDRTQLENIRYRELM